MRIEQSQVEMSAGHQLAAADVRVRRVTQVRAPEARRDVAAISSVAQSDPSSAEPLDPKLQIMLWVAEMLTGHKIVLFHVPANGFTHQVAAPSQPAPQVRVVTTTTHAEAEQTVFQASGTVATADGREISFQTELRMSRESVETSVTSGRGGTDPLALNFDGTGVRFLSGRPPFDLQGNGQTKAVPVLAKGSGWLFADRNGDGKATDGTELFGPKTGNGFGELASADSDGNGWIDESDPVFGQLRVWVQDPKGPGSVYTLSQLGVGAIAVSAAETPFALHAGGGALTGEIRSSGIYLRENGQAGVIQQADMAG